MAMYSNETVLAYLTDPSNLSTFTGVSNEYSILPVPETAGVYAWHFKNPSTGGLYIGYIGETNNLKERIRTHCTSFENSPLRQVLRKFIHGPIDSPESMRFSLENDWMSQYAFVSWLELSNHKEVEEYLIKKIRPPFNKQHNPNFRG